jgi:hypothetical protein
MRVALVERVPKTAPKGVIFCQDGCLLVPALDSSNGGFRLAELDPRLSVPTSGAAITGSSTVCAGEFCNGDGEGRSWLVGSVEAAYQRGMELASQGY